MAALISGEARRLAADHIAPGTRVLVTGAGGWFGFTALDLLHGTGASVLATASTARRVNVGGIDHDLTTWDDATVAAFRPEVILDFAFLTRDRVAIMPLDAYVATNRGLTANLVRAVTLPGVRAAITVSSGAAVFPVDAATTPVEEDPYGRLKRDAELELLEAAADRGIPAVVARAWSVSGAYVRHPRNYALADLILQARTGRMDIRATHEVWRRYVLVEELLAVAIAAAAGGGGTIDSGGPLVELGELAELIRATIAPGARLVRAPLAADPPDRYVSDGVGWDRVATRVGLSPASLTDQIGITAAGLAA